MRGVAIQLGFVVVTLAGASVCWSAEVTPEQEAEKLLSDAGLHGGLIVHLGCGDGRLTEALGASEGYVVEGLDREKDAVAATREYLQEAGVYGRVSVEQFEGERLPYVDNLVNMVVWQELCGVEEAEVMRVLAPRGVLFVRKGEKWEKRVKPWPEEIDEWTHFLHGPDNNAVARDRVVGPPRHLQWLAWPRHLRSHEHLNSVSAAVSAGGRLFSIEDEGPVASAAAPAQWRLIARDAFNGMLLWRQELGPWEGHFRLFRSGPPDIARRLVAIGDRVYVTLGYGKRVASFDAGTGKLVHTYDGTEGAIEIIYDDGRLFVVVGTIDPSEYRETAKGYLATPAPREKGIVTVDAKSGKVLWQQKDTDTEEILPTTLATANGRVFFQNPRAVVCLDAKTGKERWQSARPVFTKRLSWSAPTLVAVGDVVLSADGSTGGMKGAPKASSRVEWIPSDTDIRRHPMGDLVVLSANDGEQIWKGESLQGFCNPGDVFVIDDLVFSGALVAPGQDTLNKAFDLKTGELARKRNGGTPQGGHARCYRNKATERFLVLGGSGVEFVDIEDLSCNANYWVRGSCQLGVMPCNGLLYVPPDSCACRPEARLHGFTAMAPERSEQDGAGQGGAKETLERGPAFGKCPGRTPGTWPTYRGNAARSGATGASVSGELKTEWTTSLGGCLTSPTVGWGRVLVARIDAHEVCALDRTKGSVVWSRTVGGPVDSPPTFAEGKVVFGCRDGWVYCLRAIDGELAWRFRPSPRRTLMAPDGLESAWPVHGSVLVRDGLVWFAAGRSPYLDGGIHLCAVELATGKSVVAKRIGAGQQIAKPQMPDILSAADDTVYMGWSAFDKTGKPTNVEPHIFSATGFLDDTWWHRTYWQYGTSMGGGFGGWPQAARKVPAGRLLVDDGDTIFGFGREKYDPGNPKAVHAGHVGVIKDGYQHSGRVDHSQNPYRLFAAEKPRPGKRGKQYRWETPVPIVVRAMVLANQTLFVAGPEVEKENATLEKLNATLPGKVMAVSSSDGKTIGETDLAAMPVLDGMAAVPGRLVISCVDGSVRCLAK